MHLCTRKTTAKTGKDQFRSELVRISGKDQFRIAPQGSVQNETGRDQFRPKQAGISSGQNW